VDLKDTTYLPRKFSQQSNHPRSLVDQAVYSLLFHPHVSALLSLAVVKHHVWGPLNAAGLGSLITYGKVTCINLRSIRCLSNHAVAGGCSLPPALRNKFLAFAWFARVIDLSECCYTYLFPFPTFEDSNPHGGARRRIPSFSDCGASMPRATCNFMKRLVPNLR